MRPPTKEMVPLAPPFAAKGMIVVHRHRDTMLRWVGSMVLTGDSNNWDQYQTGNGHYADREDLYIDLRWWQARVMCIYIAKTYFGVTDLPDADDTPAVVKLVKRLSKLKPKYE